MNIWETVSQSGFEILLAILCIAVYIVLWKALDGKNVKIWQKTAIVLSAAQIGAALFAWKAWENGSVMAGIFAAVLCAGSLIGCIYGHRKGWK